MTARVSIKATIAVMIAFVIFLVGGVAGTLLFGPWDPYAAASLLFALLTGILIWFAWKGKPWALLGAILLGAFVAVASVPTPWTLSEPVPAVLLWGTTMATVLGLLMALEGFKAYSELKEAGTHGRSG